MKKNSLKLIASKAIVGSMLAYSAFSVVNASNIVTAKDNNGAVVAVKGSENYKKLEPLHYYSNGGDMLLPVVNKENGVSYSRYNDFNVDNGGLTVVNGLGGEKAKEIIAEVVSNRVSNINGNINIVNANFNNDKASFYLFNPNGINLNNASVTGQVKGSQFFAGSYLGCNEFSQMGDINISGKVNNIDQFVAKNITINNDAYVSNQNSNLNFYAYDNLKVAGSIAGENLNLNSVKNVFSLGDSNILAKKDVTIHSQEMYLDGYINANNVGLGVLHKDEDRFAPRATTNIGLGSNATIYAKDNLVMHSADKMLFAHKYGHGAIVKATNVDIVATDLRSYLTTMDVSKVFKLTVNTSTFNGDKITAGHFDLFNTLMYGETYNKLRFKDINVNGITVKGFQWKETGL